MGAGERAKCCQVRLREFEPRMSASGQAKECLLLAETDSLPWHRIAAAQGGRPDLMQARPPSTASDFRLLGDLEGVIDLDTEVSHGRLQPMDRCP